MWNDTDIPLAIFFTFRCYGTWLHGDERGSIDRFNNIYGQLRIPHNPIRKELTEKRRKHDPVILNAAQRKSTEKAIRELCEKRNWILYAFNIRTNHVHAVISIGGKKPKAALVDLKANATRQMREDRLWNLEHSPWAEKGSGRYLWNEASIEKAVDYVINGQGGDLPDFD